MDQLKIGFFLSTVRKEKGLTQEQLGERLGVSQKTVSRWETGRNMPDISMLPVICDALDINIAELMSGERIEGESVTKSDTSDMARGLISMAVQRKNAGKIIGAILSAVLAVACMAGLYNYEFSVAADTTSRLEAAINEYHFNDELRSDVMERTALGNRMYVLYEQDNHPGASGLACLEKGIFGRYRIISCSDYNGPLIYVSRAEYKKKSYAITFCVNELAGVKSYAVYGYNPSGGAADDGGELIFSHEYAGSPFLTATEMADGVSMSPYDARYFDEYGKEIDAKTLKAQFEIDKNACSAGYGTAEMGMLYFFEAILLALGMIFIRYFLTGIVKSEKKPRS